MYEQYDSVLDPQLREIRTAGQQSALKDPSLACQVISVVNQKGGCGKTTTAINLSACLASLGSNVLLIDTDPQAQASLGLGIDVENAAVNLFHVFVNGVEIEKAILPTSVERLAILPSHSILSGAPLGLMSFLARESILKGALKKFLSQHSYDYVILDCSPALNLITINCLAASEFVLIPFQTHYYSLEGMKELFYTIDVTKERLNPGLKILGLLPTLFDGRTKINEEILAQARDYFKDLVFESVIRMNVKLCEAPVYKEPIHVYAQNSAGAADYWQLTREVLERTHKQIESGVNDGSRAAK